MRTKSNSIIITKSHLSLSDIKRTRVAGFITLEDFLNISQIKIYSSQKGFDHFSITRCKDWKRGKRGLGIIYANCGSEGVFRVGFVREDIKELQERQFDECSRGEE